MVLNEKEFEILNEIKESDQLSQRSLADKLGMSLGLVNLFLKKLSSKGLIKIRKLKNKNVLKYLLTPKGFSERTNYNLYFLKKNLKYYALAKETLMVKLEKLKKSKLSNVYIYGTDEFSDIIYLGLKNYNIDVAGFIGEGGIKLGHKVYLLNDIKNIETDSVIVSESAKKEYLNGFNNVIWI